MLGNGSSKVVVPKRGNAAARRPQTGQKPTKTGPVSGPKTAPLNPVRKRLWQSFDKAHPDACWAELDWARLGWERSQKRSSRDCLAWARLSSAGLGYAKLGWAGLGWAGLWAGLLGSLECLATEAPKS